MISRQELTFDFQGAAFDLASPSDRKILGWVFNQFLYGEVTGIQCGYWLYRAPNIRAASFLARQAAEEFSHARRFARILDLLGEPKARPHFGVRFLATGMMGGTWGEHVFLEMALGEGLVLSVMYAMAQTVPSPEIRKILESSIPEEERHVAFGEAETRAWLKRYPGDRRFLLAQALAQVWAMKRIRAFVVKRLTREAGADHPVLRRFPAFYDHVLSHFEARIQKLGLTDQSLSGLGPVQTAVLMAGLPFMKLKRRWTRRTGLLTDHYLQDPALQKSGSEKEESPGEP